MGTMDKDEVVAVLIKKGYDASNMGGVVAVRYAGGTYAECSSEIRVIMKELGYLGSWGVVSKGGYRDRQDADGITENASAVLSTDVPPGEAAKTVPGADTLSAGPDDAVQFGQLSFV